MSTKVLTLTNIGTKGLNTDIAKCDLPAEFITYGKNFRVFSGSINNSLPAELWDTAPAVFNPGFLMWVQSINSYWLVAGRNSVYAFDGADWHDISSGVYAGIGVDGELNWSGCMLGNIAIVNNPQYYPEYWSQVSAGQALQSLNFDNVNTWEQKGFSCGIIRSHKNFLFALDLIENGEAFPNAYRWSHPSDINGLPFTWDETDKSALAGKAQLGGDSGRIIDGKSLRDSFVLYSEDGVDILNPTLDEFVWRREELSNTVGLVNKNCIVEVKGVHFFLGDGDILKNDGTSITSIVHDRIRKRLTSNMNIAFYNRSYAVRNTIIKEVWFCIPEGSSEYPNVAYVYNWRDDTWAIRDIPENISFAAYGQRSEPELTWATWEGSWVQQTGVWGSNNPSVLEETVIGVDIATSSLISLDLIRGVSGANVNAILERTDFPLDGHLQSNMITAVYPHMQSSSPVSIQFGGQERVNGPISWKPAVTFTPGVDRKIDIRVTGTLMSWRIESIGIGQFSLSGMDIHYSPAGLR